MAEKVKTYITRDKLIEALGISSQMIYRLSRAGILSEPVDGRWPWPEVNHQYIAYKSKKPSENKSLTEERLRRERIRADRDQLALDRERGDVIKTETAQKLWAAVMQNVVNRLDAMSSKVAPRVHGLSIPEAKAEIDKSINEVKGEIANPDLGEIARMASHKRPPKPGPSKAVSKGKRVGGSKSDAKSGGKRGTRKVVHGKG